MFSINRFSIPFSCTVEKEERQGEIPRSSDRKWVAKEPTQGGWFEPRQYKVIEFFYKYFYGLHKNSKCRKRGP